MFMKQSSNPQNYSTPTRIKKAALIFMAAIAIFSLIFSNALAQEPATPETPIESEALSTSIFGVEMTPINTQGGLSYASATQTRFVRGAEIVWADIQPNDPSTNPVPLYDWTKLNNAATEIANAFTVGSNVQPIVMIRGTPSWAQKYPPYQCGAILTSKMSAFGNFLDALIIELNNRGLRPNYWELWNEPDVPRQIAPTDPTFGGCWGDSADTTYWGGDEYKEMLQTAYARLTVSNANARVLVGGLQMDCDPNLVSGCTSTKFINGVLASGGAQYFHGIAFHAYDYWMGTSAGDTAAQGKYNNPNWPGSSWDGKGPVLVSKAKYLKNLLASYGASSKLVLNTENALVWGDFSYYSDPFPAPLERTKEAYIVQAYVNALYQGLHANVWYDMTGTWLRNNGLIKLDAVGRFDPSKDAYLAYQTIADKLKHVTPSTYKRPVTEFSGVTGVEFDLDSTDPEPDNWRHIWVLWSKDGLDHTVNIPLPSYWVYGIYDTYGYLGTYCPVGYPYCPSQITVGKMPVYLELAAKSPRVALPLIRNYYTLYAQGEDWNFENGFGTNWTPVTTGGQPVSLVTAAQIDRTTGQIDMNIPLFGEYTSAILGDPNYACNGVPVRQLLRHWKLPSMYH